MTYRDYMQQNAENLGWCKPIQTANGVAVIANSSPIGGPAAAIAAAMDGDGYELPCYACPFFADRNAMDENL